MKREEKIEVLKSYVNVNGYIYQHDIEAIADELEQQPQEQDVSAEDPYSIIEDNYIEHEWRNYPDYPDPPDEKEILPNKESREEWQRYREALEKFSYKYRLMSVKSSPYAQQKCCPEEFVKWIFGDKTSKDESDRLYVYDLEEQEHIFFNTLAKAYDYWLTNIKSKL